MSIKNDVYIQPAKVEATGEALGAVLKPDTHRLSHSPARKRWRGLTHPFQLLLLAVALFVVGLIMIVPLYLLVRSASAGSESLTLLFSPRTLQVLGNTILLAIAVPIGATIIAVPMAWLTAATDIPFRRMWSILAALPLILPSYVAAYIFVSTLSPKGLLQQFLYPFLGVERLPSIYGFPGAFLILTFITYPLIYLTVRGAIVNLDPSLEEAARSLGLTPRLVFWRVTLPHLRPGIVAGSLLVSLYVLRDFGAVTTLQYNTFTRIIYNRYLSYRLEMAALFAAVLVLMAVVILFLEQRSRGRARYARLSSGIARRRKIAQLGRWKVPALLFSASVIVFALIMPLVSLVYWLWKGWQGQQAGSLATTINNNFQVASNLVGPALHSLSASSLAAILTTLLALPVAILVVRKPGRLSWLLERGAYTGYALPGIVVALALVFFGIQFLPALYQTMPMLLAAYVILFIPLAIGAERTTLQQISPSLEEVGRSLGQQPLAVLRRITIPLMGPGLVGALLLVFLSAMKELPATLILSPLGFDSLSGQVWTNIGEAFFARAAVPTLLLLLLSSIPLAWISLRDSDH